jgi:hypothetical protein
VDELILPLVRCWLQVFSRSACSIYTVLLEARSLSETRHAGCLKMDVPARSPLAEPLPRLCALVSSNHPNFNPKIQPTHYAALLQWNTFLPPPHRIIRMVQSIYAGSRHHDPNDRSRSRQFCWHHVRELVRSRQLIQASYGHDYPRCAQREGKFGGLGLLHNQ